MLLTTYCLVFCKKAYSEKHCCNNNLWVLFSLKIPVEVVFGVWISDWRAPGDWEEAKRGKAALNSDPKSCTKSTTPHALRLPGTAVLFLPAFSWMNEIFICAQQNCLKTTGSKWSISNRPKSTFTQHLEMSRRMWGEFKAISPTIWFSLIELKLDNISVLCSGEAHTFFGSTVQQILLPPQGPDCGNGEKSIGNGFFFFFYQSLYNCGPEVMTQDYGLLSIFNTEGWTPADASIPNLSTAISIYHDCLIGARRVARRWWMTVDVIWFSFEPEHQNLLRLINLSVCFHLADFHSPCGG